MYLLKEKTNTNFVVMCTYIHIKYKKFDKEKKIMKIILFYILYTYIIIYIYKLFAIYTQQ